MIDKEKIGFVCQGLDSVAQVCLRLSNDVALRKALHINAKRCFANQFSFELAYGHFAASIEALDKRIE